MKPIGISFFLLLSIINLSAQVDKNEMGVCDLDLFKYVFNSFKIDYDNKVDDVLLVEIELHSNSRITYHTTSHSDNKLYEHVMDSILSEYTGCFPENGRLESIWYLNLEVDLDSAGNIIRRTAEEEASIKEERIAVFKTKYNLGENIPEMSITFGRRISCGPGYTFSSEEEDLRSIPILSKSFAKVKLKRN